MKSLQTPTGMDEYTVVLKTLLTDGLEGGYIFQDPSFLGSVYTSEDKCRYQLA